MRDKEYQVAEVLDTYAFVTAKPLADIFTPIGVYGKQEGNSGRILGATPEGQRLKTVPIDILNPVFPFTKEFPVLMNRLSITLAKMEICGVGAGALGSQIAMNLIRLGVGQWQFIDGDLLYPHNLTRHALTSESLLYYKSAEMARLANSIIPNTAKALTIHIDEGFTDPALRDALRRNNVVLDMSASSTALKVLANHASGRIISIFLNPQGTELVVFAEDKDKECHGDQLEIQYLRFLIQHPDLHNHFFTKDNTFRYGTGCRDISSTIPQENIALASAIASKILRNQLLQDDRAYLGIWKIDNETGETTKYSTPVFKTLSTITNDWTVKYDQSVVDKLAKFRQSKLPSETGGLLIGNYDMFRKIIYIADVINSPQDSVEYPTAYIRGKKDVKELLFNVEQQSAGALKYIGEWHSHAAGSSTNMSDDDLILFDWLKGKMTAVGCPAFMLIAGDENDISIYVQ
jgi:hypothetical protein